VLKCKWKIKILTPKSCIHLKKDDSFSPGSSG
jgi:hypothetical protein